MSRLSPSTNANDRFRQPKTNHQFIVLHTDIYIAPLTGWSRSKGLAAARQTAAKVGGWKR